MCMKHFCRPTIVRGDITIDFSIWPPVPFLVRVCLYGNVSNYSMNCFYILHLPKDLNNTYPILSHFEVCEVC